MEQLNDSKRLHKQSLKDSLWHLWNQFKHLRGIQIEAEEDIDHYK